MMRNALCIAAIALGSASCGDEIQTGPPGLPTTAVHPAASPAPDANGPGQAVTTVTYNDDDFVETERNRDPFRSYARAFVTHVTAIPQRTVLMSNTAVEEMKLIAIITGVATPRAMIVDPARVGHVVERGDYVGRPEIVNTGGGVEDTPVTLNWRVDRIRPDEVVLTREDPTAENRPPLTRVIPLNPEPDATNDQGG